MHEPAVVERSPSGAGPEGLLAVLCSAGCRAMQCGAVREGGRQPGIMSPTASMASIHMGCAPVPNAAASA